ncbi:MULTISPECIES: DUF3179 domain-containing protein [unclassified Ruegeria]|uniref:DUF3179 domain-containing protein n=1 Tax=unclassified Ruegeria TaxID=2625375 RepID=UPI00149187CA|nr:MULTISPECIES: DUF3179 domain-containing protein [unclassified Ruegeria]NOE34721.1 DUF3179 domain-containing protein [Ruegeria sp. HKCCD7318]
MSISRRSFAGMIGAGAFAPIAVWAQEDPVLEALRSTLDGRRTAFEAQMAYLRDRGQLDVVPGLLTAMRYADRRRDEIIEVMEALTGQRFGNDWFEWMLWQERNPQIVPHPSLIPFKREVLLRIDPNFDVFLQPEYLQRDRMKIRLEEIAWGGVHKDGIPSLDNPTLISASNAGYLKGDDLVFGVAINGDERAYPLRIMGWHEMFNEVIGGVPVALAYCTLCGSGILFETQVAGRRKPFIFGSSGFLYRSNKLMFDRETHSLWNQYTGKPVVGSLVNSGITLKQRPVVITTWDSWKTSHPKTRVLSLNTGHRRNYGSGVVYRDYFASSELMFPAVVDQSRHRQKDYIFAVRQFGAARAWPLSAFKSKPVINDAIAQTPLVLIGDPKERSVRAYERKSHSFKATQSGLQDSAGQSWTVTEDALIGPDGKRLSRVAGHISYWFAWDNYLGDAASIYGG